MLKKSPLLLLACFLSFSPISLSANDNIASVTHATGQTQAIRDSQAVALETQSDVFFRDILKTGDTSRLRITFIDDTRLMLGDHSELIIDEMVYDSSADNSAVFTLSQGVFRMVSGAINKSKNGTLTVKTPLATIGVRGTDFWGHQTSNKLLMALLDNGRLEITTNKGTIVLDSPLSAVQITKDETGEIFTLTEDQLNAAKKTIE